MPRASLPHRTGITLHAGSNLGSNGAYGIRHRASHLILGTVLALTCGLAGWLAAADISTTPAAPAKSPASSSTNSIVDPPAAVDFNRDVQPILAKHCYACHGPDVAKAGLRLDDRAVATAELDSGFAAIVPSKIDDSELVLRITSTEDGERMPPEGAPLTEAQIDILKRWIADGAPFAKHWAFEPPAPQTPPTVKNAAWVRNPIDAFVLHQLEQQQLAPNPAADKVALLRRAHYDLTGLPPTPAQVSAFLADTSADAYEKVLDGLLASPRYGERWGRHWLDVVRYADTNSFERDGIKPHAWRYRDYVIRSLNDDKPYDQFIREQLAGDELSPVTNDGIIATGFYRLGLWDDEPADRLLARYDVLDDIVSTTGQVFLGLTINCARCHDHKIDPIPQRDYYSLLAFFNGLTNNGYGRNVETIIFENDAARMAYEQQVRALEDRKNAAQARLTEIEKEFRTAYERLIAGAAEAQAAPLDELEYHFYRNAWNSLPKFDDFKPESSGKLPAGLFDITPATRRDDFGFVFQGQLKVPTDGEYTFFLDSDDGSRLIIDGREVVVYDGIHGTGQPRVGKAMLKQGRTPIRLEYFQRASGLGLIVAWSGPGFDRQMLSVGEKPALNITELIKSHGDKLLSKETASEYAGLQKQLEQLKKQKIPADYALCVTEGGRTAPETRILSRGNPHVPGDRVEPAYPKIFEMPEPVIPAPAADARTAGRRLVLANWIASPENRLTARVMVNRVWQHHFGRGIVRSTNNFGQLGDHPTHPELLDWLAAEFINGGWRLKPLHKLIMMSSTYRMSSQGNEAALAKDPTNDLFWRFDMRRLSAEEIRDSIFAVNGRLNLQMYGPGVYPEISAAVLAGQSQPGSGWGKSPPEQQARRSIYIHVKRSLITPLLADFDFADTDSSCATRFATTQPTQALGMLNGEFVHAQAAQLADRLQREAGAEPMAQVQFALRLATAREPSPQDVARGVDLLARLPEKYGIDQRTTLNYYCLLVLNLNEFIYLD